MRIYPVLSEQTLRVRNLLAQWKHDGHLSEEQYQRLEQHTISDLRTTNIFLRLVLLLFTVIAVAAAVALFFTLAGIRLSGLTAGICCLVFAVLSYLAAEAAAARARLYRYGVEEALAICSVAFACIGLNALLFGSSTHPEHALSLVSAVGAGSSLWLWRRFGLWYAFPAAMIFTFFLPSDWTPSHAVQRCLVCGLYAGGVVFIATIRSRHRIDHLEEGYSLAEAFLWLGIYLVLNLKLTAINAPSELWSNTRPIAKFTAAFYWTTWVLLWCLPPTILARGVRQKNRFVLAAGMITTVLTLATNKPYLGWARRPWDPMLLGIALIAVAVFLFRWLAAGPGGTRYGFTAGRISGKHKHALSIASTVLGLISPQSLTPAPQQQDPGIQSEFGGGSGGAGASGDF